MTDQLLENVLAEASLSSVSHDSIARAYPTLDELLSATLDELAEMGGGEQATRVWEVLERRWRYEAVGADLSAEPVVSRLGQIVAAPSVGERPESLRVQLRVLALLDVTMRAAGFDPDAPPADEG